MLLGNIGEAGGGGRTLRPVKVERGRWRGLRERGFGVDGAGGERKAVFEVVEDVDEAFEWECLSEE